VWTKSDALVQMLADTPVTVTAVRGGLVHFDTSSGVRVRLPVQVFRGLFDVVPS